MILIMLLGFDVRNSIKGPLMQKINISSIFSATNIIFTFYTNSKDE